VVREGRELGVAGRRHALPTGVSVTATRTSLGWGAPGRSIRTSLNPVFWRSALVGGRAARVVKTAAAGAMQIEAQRPAFLGQRGDPALLLDSDHRLGQHAPGEGDARGEAVGVVLDQHLLPVEQGDAAQ
jgi:hypothetical protein